MTTVILALVAHLSLQDAALIGLKIEEQAAIHKLDPNVIAAIIFTESTFKKEAIGTAHGERGLLQLHPKYYGNVPLDISKNLEIGVKALAYAKKRCYNRYGKAWPVCYNAGVNTKIKDAKNFPYYKKVKLAYEQIKEIKNIHSGTSSSGRVASSHL